MDNTLLVAALMLFAIIHGVLSAETFKAMEKYRLREKVYAAMMITSVAGTALGMVFFMRNFFRLTETVGAYLGISEGWLLEIMVFLVGMGCIGGIGLGLFWMMLRLGSREVESNE